ESVAAIERLMVKLGMLEAPELPDDAGIGVIGPEVIGAEPEPAPIFLDSRWVRANSAGMLIGEVSLGQRVLAGQRLGRVIDPVANTERYILAPVAGRVIGMALNQVVLPGYAAFHLGTETSEQQAVQEAVMPSSTELPEEDPDDRPESIDPESGEDFE